ncbi:MAG: choice-of-anchor tandem repeat GloVer-containing protein [Candidatus Sulfotelmatobacter sp.]
MPLTSRMLAALLITAALAFSGASFAATYKILYTFSGYSDGALPQGTLIFDDQGNLYGTTTVGGIYQGGTVFELSPASDGTWTKTVLYNFNGPNDGNSPQGGLLMDRHGTLYGTAQQSGHSNDNCTVGCGTAFALSKDAEGWRYTVLHYFHGMPDGALPSGPLVADSAGNLYGTTVSGGADDICYEGCGTVFQLQRKAGRWNEQVIHTFTNLFQDGAYPAGTMAIDGKGDLFGSSSIGGLTGYGTVFAMKQSEPGIWTEHILYNFCSEYNCEDGNAAAGGITLANGHLAGTTQMGGGEGYYGSFFVLTPGPEQSSINNFDFDTSDGAASISPVLYSGGNYYGVTEQGGNQNDACNLSFGDGVVFEVVARGATFNETVLHTFSGPDGCGPIGGLVADKNGNLYGTTSFGGSSNEGVVFEITP